jgi:uncharacterized Zn-finger protein
MRTHTGEKPFACEEDGCEFAAAKRGNLVSHMRTHSAATPSPPAARKRKPDGGEPAHAKRVAREPGT